LGPSIWAGHLVALLFSCALLYLIYRFAEDFFGRQTAFWAVLLLAIQPVFIAQSTMVLPEIILAFFCTASVYAYAKENYFQVALYSTLAILVKETAIVLPCCFGVLEFIKILNNRITKQNIIRFCCIFAPLASWGVFLVIQKIQNGWFFFPLHTGYVSFSFSSIISRLGYYLSFMFKGQGRYLWSLLIVLATVVFIWQNRRHLLNHDYIKPLAQKKKWQVSVIIIFYAMVALLVSILNFHLARYILLVLPVVCILIASMVMYLSESFENPIWKVLPLLLLLVPLFYYKGNAFNIDVDMSYLDDIKAQQEITAFVDENIDLSNTIACGFPVYFGLVENRAGYSTINHSNVFNCSNNELTGKADFFIFSSAGDMPSCKPDGREYTVVKKFKSSFSEFYLYRRGEK
jgi:4-amino-4-deoxy-L-arabinose transferase-like glycosyltransferase